MSDLVTIEEFAELLGVSRTTAEEWIRIRAIASFKKGHVRRISREDVARFVALNMVRPRRPDWLTPAVESDFRKLLRELVAHEIRVAVSARQLEAA